MRDAFDSHVVLLDPVAQNFVDPGLPAAASGPEVYSSSQANLNLAEGDLGGSGELREASCLR